MEQMGHRVRHLSEEIGSLYVRNKNWASKRDASLSEPMNNMILEEDVDMKKRNVLIILLLVILLLALCGCAVSKPKPTEMSQLANPASVNCEQKGGKLELRTAADGGTFGVCVFQDKSECEEWAYFRNECKPGDSLLSPTGTPVVISTPLVEVATAEMASDGWFVYRNPDFGYSFHYPANTRVTQNDEPQRSLLIGPINSAENWPSITLSHPADRVEFHPPQGADLWQWLVDHNLVADTRMPDAQIAGSTAIHLRHDRSPQSYADDRYYFSHNEQLYIITIGHVEDKEDWTVYNQFLASFYFD